MKYIYFILIFIFLNISAKSQEIVDFLNVEESNSKSLLLSGSGLANSGALTSEFINKWINSGFISDNIKNSSIKRMSKKNYAGVLLSGKTYFINDNYKKKSDNALSFFAGYEYNYTLSIRFSEDLFRLAFSGNKYFEDKTAYANDNKFISLAWDKIGGGVFKRFSHNKGTSVGGIAINFVRAKQYNMIYISNAEFYTAPYGEYIDAKAAFESHLSDTSVVSDFSTFNGIGFSTDLFYKYAANKNINYYFSVNNLGIIRMNNNSMYINHDTAFRFNGIELNEIIQNGSMSWNIGSTDSIIESYIPVYEHGGYNIKTPCTLRAGATWVNDNNKYGLNLDINHILFIPYIPKISLKVSYVLNGNFSLRPGISYGGFSKGNASFELAYKNKKFNIVAGSNDINGLLSPKNSSGMSAFIGLLINFKNDI